jgi:hypothetical protein
MRITQKYHPLFIAFLETENYVFTKREGREVLQGLRFALRIHVGGDIVWGMYFPPDEETIVLTSKNTELVDHIEQKFNKFMVWAAEEMRKESENDDLQETTP